MKTPKIIKNVPKYDGSGQGERKNIGRGGCADAKPKGKGKNRITPKIVKEAAYMVRYKKKRFLRRPVTSTQVTANAEDRNFVNSHMLNKGFKINRAKAGNLWYKTKGTTQDLMGQFEKRFKGKLKKSKDSKTFTRLERI